MRFGMTTSEVREAIGEEYESGTRGDSPQHPHDYFTKQGVFAYYDMSGKVEAIEFSGPSGPMLGEVDLLGLGFEDLVDLIAEKDPDVVVEDGEGFTSTKLGIGCYAPEGEDEPENPAEAVIVFRPGYYGDLYD